MTAKLFNKFLFLLSVLLLPNLLLAGGSVTFTPGQITCAPAGCGPVTLSNNTTKSVVFAGVAMQYNDPERPTRNFTYLYTGCTNGIVPAGTTCDIVINPIGFTLIAGTYPVRPLFYRTAANYSSNPNTMAVGLSFVVDDALDCTSDSQCTTNPDVSCCTNSCVDTILDINNCGSCGTVCSAGTTPGCCGSGCVDFETGPNNCGSCGTTCSGGTPDCCGVADGCVDFEAGPNNCGSCGTTCSGGTPDCCGVAGGCVDFQTDNANCGGCGVSCGTTCTAGSCPP